MSESPGCCAGRVWGVRGWEVGSSGLARSGFAGVCLCAHSLCSMLHPPSRETEPLAKGCWGVVGNRALAVTPVKMLSSHVVITMVEGVGGRNL